MCFFFEVMLVHTIITRQMEVDMRSLVKQMLNKDLNDYPDKIQKIICKQLAQVVWEKLTGKQEYSLEAYSQFLSTIHTHDKTIKAIIEMWGKYL